MSGTRYLNVILTVIALELGWMALTRDLPVVSAQAQAPQRVVISGVDLGTQGYMPVGIVGAVRNVPFAVSQTLDPQGIRVQAGRPLQIDSQQPVSVRLSTPVKVETDRPIKVENVGYTPAPRPGE
jgi:hypothetical protein